MLFRSDPRTSRVRQVRETAFGGIPWRQDPLPPGEWQPDLVQGALAEGILAHDLPIPALEDESLVQWMLRIRHAARLLPAEGWPDLDADWPLILHEACREARQVADLTAERIRGVLDELLGPWLVQRLQRIAPSHWPLPSGRRGKVVFHEEGLPELVNKARWLASARNRVPFAVAPAAVSVPQRV